MHSSQEAKNMIFWQANLYTCFRHTCINVSGQTADPQSGPAGNKDQTPRCKVMTSRSSAACLCVPSTGDMLTLVTQLLCRNTLLVTKLRFQHGSSYLLNKVHIGNRRKPCLYFGVNFFFSFFFQSPCWTRGAASVRQVYREDATAVSLAVSRGDGRLWNNTFVSVRWRVIPSDVRLEKLPKKTKAIKLTLSSKIGVFL